jgi:hypothetical protein
MVEKEISLIFTKHKEAGQCNSAALLRILESVKPEVIFEELSFSNFHKIYKEQSITTLESDAIKQHLLTNAIKQVPVDTYDLPIDYYNELDLMYDKLISYMKFTEAHLEQAFIDLLGEQGYPYVPGERIVRTPDEVLIIDDLKAFLQAQYKAQNITPNEIDGIVKDLQKLPASDLYETNKTIMHWVRDGFVLKR